MQTPTLIDSPASRYPAVHWLEPDQSLLAQLRRAVRWALAASAVLIMIVAGVFAWAYLSLQEQPELAQKIRREDIEGIAWLGLYLAVSLPVMFFFVWRELRHRLGTDGQLLYLADHTGRARSMLPRQVVYTPRLAAGGAVTVMLRTGHGKSLYVQEELRAVLQGARRVGEWEMLRYLIRHRHPFTLAAIAFAVLGVAVLAATGLWRKPSHRAFFV